jgi:uncharacterized protein
LHRCVFPYSCHTALFYCLLSGLQSRYLNEKTRKYIPDFLVRKWSDNTAHLIEIKPKKYLNSEKMHLRNIISEQYLELKNVDWKFKVITEEDIVLNDNQKALFNKIIEDNKNLKGKLAFINKDKKYNNSPQKYFRSIPYLNSTDITTEDYIKYVRYGILPTTNGEQNILMEEFVGYSKSHEKNKHKKLLKIPFQINCSNNIFKKKEIEILKEYGTWLEALIQHELLPITVKQSKFIEQIEKGIVPEEEIPKVWFKYIKRKEIEEKYGDKLNTTFSIDNNDFYRREDYYKLHKDKKRRI